MTVLTFPTNSKTIPEGHTSGPDLAHAAGITYRQLDYWTRTGYLHCAEATPGSGCVRAYPADEVTLARLAAQLLSAGLAPKAAFALANQLLEHGHATLAGIRIDLPQDL